MAFRLSDRDRAASQAAAAIRQANRAQANYDLLMPQVQAKMAQAQQGPSNPLESVLSGIGNSIVTAGKGLGDFITTGAINTYAATGLKSLLEGKSYTQAAREARRDTEDFQKRYYNADSVKDAYAKSAGTALDTASTLSDLIPGLGTGAKVALNVGQGVASGFANPFIEKGSKATLEDAMRGAAVGGASAGVGQYVGGKLAGRTAGKGAISKALNSNIGKAALTGAVSGAAGGGLNAALSGGDLGQTLGGAWQGAQGGALAGGAMAGTMGLIGTGIDKLNQKYGAEAPTNTPVARRTPVATNTEAEPTNVAQRNIETPTRRAIDVQYDGEAEPVDVSRRASNQYRLAKGSGSTLDGVLGPNNKTKLPNALPDTRSQFRRLFGDDTSDISAAVKNGLLDASGDDAISGDAVLKDILDKNTYDQLRAATREYADYNNSALDGYGVSSKSQLPKIRTSDYIEATGYKGQDIPDYMRPFLSEENGRSLKDSSWSQIMPQYNNEGQFTGTPDDVLQMYDDLAGTNRNVTYTNDNLVGALETNPDLYVKATEQVLADSYPTRKIDVDKRLPLGLQVDVDTPDSRPLIRDVRPATRQAQPVATTADVEAPVQRIRRSADTSGIEVDPNLDPSRVAELERRLTVSRQKQGSALLNQYGTLDAPVRRALGAPEDVLATLYDDYGLKTPTDVQYAANHVTGRDGVVSQMTRELAGSAKNVDTTISREWLQDMMELNGLTDDEQKVVVKQLSGALKRGGESVDGNTALDVIKQLEKQSARYKGKDNTYHHGTESEGRKAIALDLVHDELEDRLWSAAGDPKKVLTPKRLAELKGMYKDNETWTNFIDNKLAKARSGAELRSAMKPLVDGSKIVYGSKQSAGGFADRAYKAATSANPIVAFGQMTYDAALGSDKAKQMMASKYANDAAKAKAELTGQQAPKSKGVLGTAGNIGKKAIAKAGKVTGMLDNSTFSGREISPIVANGQTQTIGDVAARQLARQSGLGAARYQDNQAALQSAAQEMQDIQNNYDNSMMQAQQSYAQAQQMPTTQGSETLDRVSRAMDLALSAGNLDAYSQLADLYKQAYGIYQLQNPTASSANGQSDAKALTANQTKALTGLQQLQSLSGMQPGLGTALASSPLGGVVNMFGGDDYANQAQSLALTLGYLQSGANITPREAESIGRAYIPTAYDSEGVRQNKLSRAEQLLRNYLADSSALQ